MGGLPIGHRCKFTCAIKVRSLHDGQLAESYMTLTSNRYIKLLKYR
jgi:acetolactate synthase regulatory subunit